MQASGDDDSRGCAQEAGGIDAQLAVESGVGSDTGVLAAMREWISRGNGNARIAATENENDETSSVKHTKRRDTEYGEQVDSHPLLRGATGRKPFTVSIRYESSNQNAGTQTDDAMNDGARDRGADSGASISLSALFPTSIKYSAVKLVQFHGLKLGLVLGKVRHHHYAIHIPSPPCS